MLFSKRYTAAASPFRRNPEREEFFTTGDTEDHREFRCETLCPLW